ncbi:MAG: PAS domain-containing protein [Methylococcaceae bacterium]|nr:PAS domain-containing protein [Methylococcaceae bacterium]
MPYSVSKNDIIYPCPFSKGYGIPSNEAWSLLKVFFLYRILLSCALLVLFYFPLESSPLDYLNPQLFIFTSQAYFGLTLLAGVGIFTRFIPYTPQAQLLIFTDIAAITLLLHACGGIASGIGILLVISIAFGGILIGGLCAMLFAAIASLAILTEQTYAIQRHVFNITSYTEAGMLGVAFFTTALLAYILAQRSEQSQLIAQQHKQTILKLEELNRAIIQHLQTGIIITDHEQNILMLNQAALRLLNKQSAPPLQLQEVSIALTEAFECWLGNLENNMTLLSLPEQMQVHCRFSLLPTHQEILHMLMLEDNALYNQRLQQSKLASLGRLTASIAHEIRNPLGAISHAAQLLAECPSLTEQDLRLTEIIQTHSLRMNGIIEEILQLSRRKTSQRQKIALNKWLSDYLDNFKLFQHRSAEQVRLSLSQDDLHVLIDPDHLQQIMDNLCLNAFKHNQSLSPRLMLTTEQTNQGVCINIIDNGKSISAENAEHLFEPFFTTSTSGTGLGLYISRELAELNQAKLSYHIIRRPGMDKDRGRQEAVSDRRPGMDNDRTLGDPDNDLNNAQFNHFRLCLSDAEQPKLEL